MIDVMTSRGVGRSASGPFGHAERGMVTLETAFAVMVLALALALSLAVVGAAFVLGQLQVGANEVARQAARGDAAAVERAKEDLPRGASVVTRTDGGVVVVEAQWVPPLLPGAGPLVASARVVQER